MNKCINNLVIFASPNNNSFTQKKLDEELLNFEGNTFVFDCFKQNPLPCNDCGYCKENHGCLKKDLDLFFEYFEGAKNIIFAFPVYNNSFPAPLKALIDRFQPYFCNRFVKNNPPIDRNKHSVTIIMTMGGKKDVSDLILAQISPLFSITGCTIKKVVTITDTDNSNVLEC